MQTGKSMGSVLQQVLLLLSAGAVHNILPIMLVVLLCILRSWHGAVNTLADSKEFYLPHVAEPQPHAHGEHAGEGQPGQQQPGQQQPAAASEPAALAAERRAAEEGGGGGSAVPVAAPAAA